MRRFGVALWLGLVPAFVDAGGWLPVEGSSDTGCAFGTNFTFFVKRGDPSKLMIELEEGGCCFNSVTCSLPDYFPADPPNITLAKLNSRGGIGDERNPLNPVANWSRVFVPYCTGDAHTGNNTPSYGTRHFGRRNFFSALRWAIANVPSPELVLTGGSSAGAVGTYVLAPWVMDSYPLARHVTIADSYAPLFGQLGYNDGYQNWELWGAFNSESIPITKEQTYPWHELINSFALNMTARAYPQARFATYVSAYDSVESAFYLVEGCGLDGCDWPRAMRHALQAVDAPNYHTFIGPGTLHVAWGGSQFYTITSDGVKLVDWMRELLDDKAVPRSVDCKPHCA